MPAPSVLQGNRAISSAGYLTAQSTDPTLRSCNNRLADNPRAQAIADSVEPVLVASGLITQAEFADLSTILIVTDDPTSSAYLFVAAVTAVPSIGTSPGSLTAIVATLDRKSMRVLSVGNGHWYDGVEAVIPANGS
jgi:hypothetical protein